MKVRAEWSHTMAWDLYTAAQEIKPNAGQKGIQVCHPTAENFILTLLGSRDSVDIHKVLSRAPTTIERFLYLLKGKAKQEPNLEQPLWSGPKAENRSSSEQVLGEQEAWSQHRGLCCRIRALDTGIYELEDLLWWTLLTTAVSTFTEGELALTKSCRAAQYRKKDGFREILTMQRPRSTDLWLQIPE